MDWLSGRGWILGLLLSGALGCSLPRGVTTTQPTSELDASIEARDATTRDANGEDASLAEDAFTAPNDAGCTTAPFCEGTTVVTCEGRTDCAASGRACADGACVDVCTGGATRCTGSLEERCDDGRWAPSTMCPIGCGETSCRPVPTCAPFTPVGALAVGGVASPVDFDLCDGAIISDYHLGMGDCNDANGNEIVLTLDVPTTRTITIDLRDHDTSHAVDTVLYVRTACSELASEVACDDDQPCDPADGVDDACAMRGDGRIARFGHSRISRSFEPGRYYVFVDSLRSTDCGTVSVYATSP